MGTPDTVFDGMSFRDKLVRLAKERRMDLKRVAEYAGIPYNSLRRYAQEGASGAPDARKGIALASVLGVPVEWLFDDDQEWPPPPPWQKGPPFPIYPWPPHGISWPDVQYAIWAFFVDLYRNAARDGEPPPDMRERIRAAAEAVLKELQAQKGTLGASDELVSQLGRVVFPGARGQDRGEQHRE